MPRSFPFAATAGGEFPDPQGVRETGNFRFCVIVRKSKFSGAAQTHI